MAKPDKDGGTPPKPNEGKPSKEKKLSHTLKDNRLYIPGFGTVEKKDFTQEHFDTIVKLEKNAVSKYCVKLKEAEETEE